LDSSGDGSMKYEGKDLTVVTVEHLILTFTKSDYYPPKKSAADEIFRDNVHYHTRDIFACLQEHVGEKISWMN
jgi:hypothetical protein